MIDPRSVEVFWWVVRLGGFRRAADRLGTTQPAISARIAALEAAVGARLLDRGRRRAIVPTAPGLRLLGFAERQMALAAEMQAAFSGPAALRGAVRLGVAETIVHTWLSVLLRRLHDAYPLLEIDILVDVSPALRAGLLAGEIDVALLLGPVAAPGVHDIPLCDYPLAWVAAPGLGLGALPLDLDAIAAHPIVTYARTTRPHRQLRDLFAARLRPALPARIFANASLASIARMVQDGIGVGVIAPAAIRAELEDDRLQLLDVSARLDPLHFTASWRGAPDGGLSATVATLAAAVAAEHTAMGV